MIDLTSESRLIDDALSDPVNCYFKDVLQVAKIYPKQEDMILSVRDHKRTAVLGCNSSGKDYTSGRLLLWWLSTHYPALVVVFGPTERQVNEVVFNETRRAHAMVDPPLGGTMNQRTPSYHFDPQNFALGISTDKPFNITGFHSPNLFVIITEAHAMEEEKIKMILTLHAKRILLTGNAFTTSGTFFAAFHKMRARWSTIRIRAEDTPNIIEGREVIPGLITQEIVEDLVAEWGEESPMFQASVRAEFPDSLSDTIISWQLAEKARARRVKAIGEKVAAIDVARGGLDLSVLAERQGMFSKFIWKHRARKADGEKVRLTELAGKLQIYLEENPDVSRLMIDDVGIGGGLTDIMMETEFEDKIVEFRGGDKASNEKRFVDQNAECWWAMREAYNHGLQAPDDDTLAEQVAGRKYIIQGDRRIALQKKEELAKSPDEADALAMTFMDTGPRPGITVVTPGPDVPQQTRVGEDGVERPATRDEMQEEHLRKLEEDFALGDD